MKAVSIAGGGPAGASAAIAAIVHGASAHIAERARFPRHKVCGEFLSPEIYPLLEKLGVAARFDSLGPARVRRMIVRIGRREKLSRLPEAAFGLSRYAFDAMLLDAATTSGAVVHAAGSVCDVVASGRSGDQRYKGWRLFGFKAHFEGLTDDAVELYFFDGCYVGINCIEGGLTNVCGIAPESILREDGFDADDTVARCDALERRLGPLTRTMKWMFTGPLDFINRSQGSASEYVAGDALSFVDPFTGSGILSAVATGSLAGEYAARELGVEAYQRACRSLLARPYEAASALRWVAGTRWAEHLLETVPGQLLYWATRPRVRV